MTKKATLFVAAMVVSSTIGCAASDTLATTNVDSRPDVFDVARTVQDGEHRTASQPTSVTISSCPSVTTETINNAIRICKKITDAPKMRSGETFASFERRFMAFLAQDDHILYDQITSLIGPYTYSLGDYALAAGEGVSKGEGVGKCGAGGSVTGGAVSRRGQPGISRGKCAVAISGGYLSLDNSWFGSDMCVKTWRVGNQQGRLPINPTILTDPRWQDCGYMKIIKR